MASKPITLIVEPRGKPLAKLPQEIHIYLQGSTSELYNRISAESGCTPDRIRLTKGSDGSVISNAKEVTVESTGVKNRSVIYVKDLGPQIAWRTVFLIEYLGPMLIHPLFYLLRKYIFSTETAPSHAQKLACILITIHFIKREIETLFVHRFSNSTMPVKNIFKNSAHYWLLAGFNIAFWIYKPGSPTERVESVLVRYVAFAMFMVGETGNLLDHLILRSLRKEGGTERGLPRGIGFDSVTCPNYGFEALAWVGIWLLTWSLSTGLFVVVAVGQMYIWARKKESRYRKEFGDKYKRKRFAMIPFLA